MPVEPSQLDADAHGKNTGEETLPPPTVAPTAPIGVTPSADLHAEAASSPSSQADNLVGQQIGPYILRRKLGQGGMGAVFEAVHESIGQRTAIKVLHARFSEDSKVAERFVNEARATSIVRHPGLMKVYDQQKLPSGALCLIMEFLDGESLESRLQRLRRSGARLPTAQAVEIIRQAASALQAAHEAGIVHCDRFPPPMGGSILSRKGAQRWALAGKILLVAKPPWPTLKYSVLLLTLGASPCMPGVAC